MNCLEARRHWHLFHDSEGDAELHLQINSHLSQCKDCARWYSQQSAVEEAVTRTLCTGLEPTADMWRRIEQSIRPSRAIANRGWVLFGSTALALAAAVLVMVGLNAKSPMPNELATLSADWHGKFSDGGVTPAYVSTSHLEIEDYLKKHVSFPVRCPPREDAGFQAVGGGTCQLANNPVAYVVGRVDGKDVTLFILSRESIAQFSDSIGKLRPAAPRHVKHGDLDIVMTEFDQNLVVVVGKVTADKLRQLLRAYGSYPHVRQTAPQRFVS